MFQPSISDQLELRQSQQCACVVATRLLSCSLCSLRSCVVQNFACQNHVRAVLRVGSQLFVCATGVDAPIVYYLDVSNIS